MIKNKQHHLAALAQFIGAIGFNLFDKDMRQTAISTLVNEPHRQHGFRIENMFAYVAGALGKCSLVKQEDAGTCLSIDENVGIPDYRIILSEGATFFVEVKNCSKLKLKFRKEYIKKLLRYSAINNISLKIAVYWRAIEHWTLTPVENFEFQNSSFTLSLDVAMATSEMAILGDRIIGTLAPLKLRLVMDVVKTTTLDATGKCQMTIEKTEVFSKDTLIESDAEKNIAIKLISSGKWEEVEEVIVVDNKVVSIDYKYSPIDPPADNSFSFVASLSSIVSSFYNDSTTENGKIKRLLPDAGPSAFEIPIPEKYEGKYLPLWQFILQPNLNYK
jgi:Holliday junction resolvase